MTLKEKIEEEIEILDNNNITLYGQGVLDTLKKVLAKLDKQEQEEVVR
jgi:hypothetical protein